MHILTRLPGESIIIESPSGEQIEVTVPVQNFGDQHTDPQLAHRGHFVSLTQPFLGPVAVARQRRTKSTGWCT